MNHPNGEVDIQPHPTPEHIQNNATINTRHHEKPRQHTQIGPHPHLIKNPCDLFFVYHMRSGQTSDDRRANNKFDSRKVDHRQ